MNDVIESALTLAETAIATADNYESSRAFPVRRGLEPWSFTVMLPGRRSLTFHVLPRGIRVTLNQLGRATAESYVPADLVERAAAIIDVLPKLFGR